VGNKTKRCLAGHFNCDGKKANCRAKITIPASTNLRLVLEERFGAEQQDFKSGHIEDCWAVYNAKKEEESSNCVVDIWEFQVDSSFPFPQANSLAKVAATVDAIDGGADTDEAVALAIEVTPRQGAYYANAAAFLGMVAPMKGAMPRQWGLTSAGLQFLNSTAATRATILSHVVAQIPEVDSLLNDGFDIDELLSERLGESTASRRAATIDSWLETLTDTGKAQEFLTLETDGVLDRIDAAKAVAVRAREEERRRAKVERATAICPECFMTLPFSGVCSTCEDD